MPPDVFRNPPRAAGRVAPPEGEQMWKEPDVAVGRGGARRWHRFEVAKSHMRHLGAA